MIGSRSFTAVLAFVGLLIASPASAQSEIAEPDGDWTHSAVDVSFPDRVGPLERRSIYEYDDTGRDASVGYRLVSEQGDLILTVYVYPAPAGYSCREVFEDALNSIRQYPGSRLLLERMARAPDGSRPASARVSRFLIPESAMREGVPEMISDAYLYCVPGGEWMVKYRASWSGSEETFPDVMAFMTAIDWPVSLIGD